MRQWAEEECGVSDAAGDDNVGALLQRRNDRPRTKVSVGKHHAITHRIKRGATEHMRRRQAIDLFQDLITCHNGDARGPAFGRKSGPDRSRCTGRIEAARVADKANFSLRHRRPQGHQEWHHVPSVAQ